MAHKFGNPLAAITSSANLLVRYHDRLTDDKRETHQNIINGSVTRLTTMVADILSVLRRDTDSLISRVQTITLAEVCQAAILAAETTTRTQDRVQLRLHIERVQINASPQRLVSIITHLLTNALKFSSEDVHLTLDHQDNQLTVTAETNDDEVVRPVQFIGYPSTHRNTELFHDSSFLHDRGNYPSETNAQCKD